MSDVKFTLLKENRHYAAGVTAMNGYVNRPLSSGGCTLFICMQGRAVVSVNFRKLVLKAGDIIFLFSDMVFLVSDTSRNFSAFYCAISADLLNEATYNTSWDFYEYLYVNPICPTTAEQYAQLMIWQQQIAWFVDGAGQGQQHSFMRNSIQNLFLGVDREMKRNPELLLQTQRKSRAWAMVNQFFLLLAEHCQQHRSVRFYADKLCITPYYLFKITNKILRLSPKEIIDQQIVVEIKMYLTCTDCTVKEIAEKLNFDDPSYLCRFFRRYTGKSPTDYKTEFI